MSKKSILTPLFSFLCIVIWSSSVFAQGTTSRISGTITDNAGSVVSGANVTLTNEATKIALTTQTNNNGFYTFDLIQPGNYQVAVEKQGFKRFVSTGNTIFVNQPATLNAALEIGDVSATITIESSVEQVQTSTSGNVGSIVETKTLESLPIVGTRGRNPFDLLNYQPGVVSGANTGGGVHVHGSRDRAFNFTLDGVDINESTAGGSNFTPLRANPEAIQEFQIVTSNSTAELGRSSGAQVTLTTKSGTNRVSGNLFEFYQTPRFNANEYELNLLGISRRQFVQHIFGGSVGGPIVIPGFGEDVPFFRVLKDRAFFFTNVQFLRANETRLQQSTVYTDLARQGIFRYVEGGRNGRAGQSVTSAFPTGSAVNPDGSPRFPNCGPGVPTPCIRTFNVNNNLPASVGTTDPFITSLLRTLPSPNDFTTSGDGLNFARFNFVAPQIEKQYDFTARFDVKINDNNQMYVRYSKGQQDSFGDIANAGLQRFPDRPNWVDTFRNPENLAINYRSALSPKLTNEFIFGLNRFGFQFAYPGANPAVPFILNIPTDPDRNFAYNARRSRTFQFVDNVTWDLSPHILKMGLNFRLGNQVDDRSSAGGQIEPQVFFSAGQSNFDGYNLPSTGINTNDLNNLRSTVNDLIGRIGSINQGFVVSAANPNDWAPAGTRWIFNATYPEYDFYIQDTWRVKRNLTFDIGLRWEFKPSPGSEGLPILRPGQDFTASGRPTNSLRWEEGQLFNNDYNNLSPSVGFAWDPFSDGKTSVRANYRLAYDRFPSQVFANFVYQSAPGNTFQANVPGIENQNLLIRNGIPNLFPTQTPNQLRQPPPFSTTSITLVDPDIRFPESHQWFAGVQRQFGATVVEANYIGRKGTHLFGAYNSNQVNIFASDPRCPKNFLQTFNDIRAGSTNECLTNLLFTGSTTNNAGTATFRGINVVNVALQSGVNGGGVAAAALAASQAAASGVQRIGNPSGFNNPYFFQKYPQYTGGVGVLESNDFSFYNGLELIAKRRLSNGFSFQASYTYSVSKDTRSFDPTFATFSTGSAQSASSTPFDINNRRLNYSWSDFDRRHVLQGYYVYELPIGDGRAFGKNMPKVLDVLVGGWQLSGTINYGSGRPFTVFSGINTFSNSVSSTANCNNCPRDLGKLIERNGTNYWFTEEQVALFSIPNPGEQGNTPRNYFIGPRQFQTDASLFKKFKFNERFSFDLRVDARNLTNSPSFGIPTATVTSGSNLGEIRTAVASFARRIQFSGKLNF